VPKTAIDKSNESNSNTTTTTTLAPTATGPVVGEIGAMNQTEINQEKLNNALQQNGVNRGFASGVQTRPGGPGFDAKE
jgi:hypothetical protein